MSVSCCGGSGKSDPVKVATAAEQPAAASGQSGCCSGKPAARAKRLLKLRGLLVVRSRRIRQLCAARRMYSEDRKTASMSNSAQKNNGPRPNVIKRRLLIRIKATLLRRA